jgi:hypothetical protein
MGDGGGSLGFGTSAWWFTAALLLLVVVRFLARELRLRRVPLNRFFAVPIVFGLISAWLIYLAISTAPDLTLEMLIAAAAAVAVGAGVGLAVDRYTAVALSDDGTKALIRGSRTTVAIWIGALILRWVGRWVVLHVAGTVTLGMTLVLNAALVILLGSAATVLRVLLFRRARALRLQRSAAPA